MNHLIAIDEVLTSWQGDDAVQFVELRLLQAGQGRLTDGGGTGLVVFDASGDPDHAQTFRFTTPVANQIAGARILIASRELATLTNLQPDFVLPAGALPKKAGRICYVVYPPQETGSGTIDCVAYGAFRGDNAPFGTPTPVTPDDRALQRVDTTGENATDWSGVLQPTPQTNAGAGFELATLCGNGEVNQGEDCDGAALGGKTCIDFGFASGKLRCAQCHAETSHCSQCGNGVVNGREQCDGADLRDRTCADLGFTGGTLACTRQCGLDTAACDPTFFVPGGGPGPDCLAEWQVTNAAARPGADGRAPSRQRCRDGDAGCDADTTAGQCTFHVALCLSRSDPRLTRNGKACARVPTSSVAVLVPDPTDALVAALTSAVAALGQASIDGGLVTFAPALDATERCTTPVDVAVPTRGTRPGVRLLRVRTAGDAGHPRDTDTLKLVCAP